ncbi:MAG: hypothetical protein RR840_04790 [Clostridium sp.]
MNNQPYTGDTPYFVKVEDAAGFSAYLHVSYYSGGEMVDFDTPYMNVFEYEIVAIPADARDIYVDVFMAIGIQTWQRICSLQIPSQPQICYNLYGTIFNPSCQKVECTPPGVVDMQPKQIQLNDSTRRVENPAIYPPVRPNCCDWDDCCYKELDDCCKGKWDDCCNGKWDNHCRCERKQCNKCGCKHRRRRGWGCCRLF